MELQRILYSPTEMDFESSFLIESAILDSASPIPATSYLYEVDVSGRDTEWQVRVSPELEEPTGTVQSVFNATEWEFTGTLSAATRHYE